MTRTVALGAALTLFAAVAAAQSPPSLDYEYFKTRVQPIFVAKRAGHARCVSCHTSGTPLRLQPLAPGAMTWSEEDSRKNFEAVKRVAAPGNAKSKLLMHPLAEKAGGDFFHNGGKHWASQDDPEWQTLKTFVMGTTAPSSSAATRVVIVQTNSAGDNVHVIDPATNAVIGQITGIEANHGAAIAPDGSRIYISNESLSTLDVVDGRTLKVVKQIPLSAHPNNLAVGRDGRRVYVGIIQAPGGVDVIDTATLQRVKTLATQGTIHNVYATPDGKFIVAGSIAGKTINVFDAATETPAWTLELDLGIRPMTFSTNPDGSTKWLFAQLTGFNGFAVIDFTTHKEIRRITNPDLPPGRSTVPEGSDPSHGMAVTADQRTLVVCSRLNNALYSYSLPDLKVTGTVFLGGKGAAWVTLTPDGRKAYVANAVTDDVSVVDVPAMKEVALIPVGFVPKRNTTGILLQHADMPRTADGHPDLQGIWDFRSATPLERPARFAGKEFMTDEDVRAYEKLALEREDGRPPDDARGLEEQSVHPVWWLDYGKTVIKTHRTSLIVDPPDGKIPALTEQGRKRAAARREAARSRGPADDPEIRALQERCITWGVPQGLLPGPYNNNLQIVQTPTAVALFTEMIHNARTVTLDGRAHAPAAVRSWNGDPRGHWEGDTLVVDSTNFSDQTNFRGASANLHLVERFTLVDANTLEYRFTVDDPTTWTRPWTVAYPMIRTQDQIYEYACHEANYGLRNTLAAARAEEKK